MYEIGKDFRNEGVSFKHNPEFTVLEWYEAYADYEDIARRCEALVAHVAERRRLRGRARLLRRRGGARRWRTRSARAAASTSSPTASSASLQAAMRERGLEVPEEETWGQLVDHLLSKYVEPELVQPTFLRDYPVEISPFAKRHRAAPGLTERWEAFAGGMEFANAFTELNDPDDQRARFEEQRRFAAAGDAEAQPFDEAYLQALEHGMPPTGGIGIGIDRLVMLLTGQRHDPRGRALPCNALGPEVNRSLGVPASLPAPGPLVDCHMAVSQPKPRSSDQAPGPKKVLEGGVVSSLAHKLSSDRREPTRPSARADT